MKFIIFLFLLTFFIEATLTTLPLVLLFLLILSLIARKISIFTLSFFSGIFLDIFSLRPIGETSLYLCLFFFLVYLYEHKYETATFPFVFAASFLGSFGFILFFSPFFLFTSFEQAILCGGAALLAVFILNLKNTKKNSLAFGTN